MSSYLNFYLVPKKEKIEYDETMTQKVIKLSEGLPLAFISYCGSSNVCEEIMSLNPVRDYNGEGKYTELTYDDMKIVIDNLENKIKEDKRRLEIDYKVLKQAYNPDVHSQVVSFEDYIYEEKETLEELKFIARMVNEVYNDFTNFEKVLINIS